MSCSSALASRDQHSPQQTEAVTIEGTVRGTDGNPLAGATVVLEEKGNPRILETKTSATGTFVLSADHRGTFTVRAQKPGCADTVVDALFF
jgi:protocatechuate 3,4-dioxygenase beta subunit